VMNLKDALPLIEEVRRIMKEKLYFATEHDIGYALLDSKKLDELSPNQQRGLEMGLFQYVEEIEKTILTKTNMFGEVKKTESEKVDKSYKIYLIYAMSRRKFIEVTAHELGHDWMQEYYPKINDLKIKEGWAEYVASKVNEEFGNKTMNLRMEKNPDPVYGEGYRMIKSIAEKSSTPMDSLHRFFRDNSK
jgi:hypothetical protein